VDRAAFCTVALRRSSHFLPSIVISGRRRGDDVITGFATPTIPKGVHRS
jgi:hypothetical protein